MCMTHVRVSGHSQTDSGGMSVACAAVSALVRTAGRLIEADSTISSRGGAESTGELLLDIEYSDQHRKWLRGVTDFLVIGLKDVERDYPQECRVELEIQEEERHGT